MKTASRMTLVLVSIVTLGGLAIAEDPNPAMSPPQAQTGDYHATMRDIQNTLGFVPQFARRIPAAILPGFWSEVKSLEMNQTTNLDAKTKELIGIAVAAQIPCQYCMYWHSQAAKAHGASDAEIREAVGMAALTREGSTLMNGLGLDMNQFKRDVDRMMENQQQRPQSSQNLQDQQHVEQGGN